MISVVCKTNLDDYQYVQWPSIMVVRPEIGDMVKSIDRQKVLYVVSITHCYNNQSHAAYLEVELHKK